MVKWGFARATSLMDEIKVVEDIIVEKKDFLTILDLESSTLIWNYNSSEEKKYKYKNMSNIENIREEMEVVKEDNPKVGEVLSEIVDEAVVNQNDEYMILLNNGINEICNICDLVFINEKSLKIHKLFLHEEIETMELMDWSNNFEDSIQSVENETDEELVEDLVELIENNDERIENSESFRESEEDEEADDEQDVDSVKRLFNVKWYGKIKNTEYNAGVTLKSKLAKFKEAADVLSDIMEEGRDISIGSKHVKVSNVDENSDVITIILVLTNKNNEDDEEQNGFVKVDIFEKKK